MTQPYRPDTRWRVVVGTNPITVRPARGNDPSGGVRWAPYWLPWWQGVWMALTMISFTYPSIEQLEESVRVCEEWCRRMNEWDEQQAQAVAPYQRARSTNPQLDTTPSYIRKGL